MEQIQKNIQNHLSEHGSIYTFIGVLTVMGVLFGAIIVNSLSLSDKQDLLVYLKQFFGEMSDGKLDSGRLMFFHSFSHYMKYIGFIWLLGLSVIGLPIILILLFLKGVVVGFTVGFLVDQMGWHGLLVAFASIFPQNLILIPAFVIIGTAAVSFSFKMIGKQFTKTISTPILPQFMRYSLLVVAVGMALLAVSFYEAFVSPIFMKVVS